MAYDWRRKAERDGVAIRELRACDAEARDGTQLPRCVKVYLPPPVGAWGAVLALAIDPVTGRAVLDYLAFGLRHPPTDRRLSVYDIAHRRLHLPPERG